MPSILFVCTGNQCRSPVAARLFAAQVQKLSPTSPWVVESAGVWAVQGNRSPVPLIRIALQHGIDLRSHRARSIELLDELERYELIVTMEQSQCESLRVEFPSLAQRLHLLSALSGPAYDIADPMGGSDEAYRSMLDELGQLIVSALPEIERLTKHTSYVQTHNPSYTMALAEAD